MTSFQWFERAEGLRENVLDDPDTVLMKICIVSSWSEALELRLEVLFERRIVASIWQRAADLRGWMLRLWMLYDDGCSGAR